MLYKATSQTARSKDAADRATEPKGAALLNCIHKVRDKKVQLE